MKYKFSGELQAPINNAQIEQIEDVDYSMS